MNQQVPSIYNRRAIRNVGGAVSDSLGVAQHPRISIMGNRFTLVDAGGEKYPWPNLELDVIIVDANPHTSKVYFPEWDPSETAPPICYSDNGIAPSINAADKQSPTCASCPLGAWGSETSKMTGRGIKACVDKKKLAVYPVDDTTGLLYELVVPPNSLKALNTYSRRVKSFATPDGSRNADLPDVVTRITFQPNTQGTLEFAESGWIDGLDNVAQVLATIDEAVDAGITDQLVNKADAPAPAHMVGQQQQARQISAQPENRVDPAQSVLARPPAPRQVGAPPVQHPFPQDQRTQAPVARAQTLPVAQDAQPPAQQPAGRRGGARTGAGRPRQTAAQATAPAPATAPRPQAPRARQPMEPAATPAPQQADSGIPRFLQRQPAAAQQQMPQQATGAAYGMEQGEMIDQGMDDALHAAFALDTERR